MLSIGWCRYQKHIVTQESPCTYLADVELESLDDIGCIIVTPAARTVWHQMMSFLYTTI